MKIVLIFILIGIGVRLIINLINLIIPYYDMKNNEDYYCHYPNCYWSWFKEVVNLPKFTFNEFIHFKDLNPEAWFYIDEDGEMAELPARRLNRPNNYTDEYYYQPIFFTDMFEYKKYRDWAKVNIEFKRFADGKIKQDKATKEILNLAQEDIDKLTQNNRSKINNVK